MSNFAISAPRDEYVDDFVHVRPEDSPAPVHSAGIGQSLLPVVPVVEAVATAINPIAGVVVTAVGTAVENVMGVSTSAPAQDGKDGKDGSDGINGKDGKDGSDGINGINGKDGKDGSDGKDGKQGNSNYCICKVFKKNGLACVIHEDFNSVSAIHIIAIGHGKIIFSDDLLNIVEIPVNSESANPITVTPDVLQPLLTESGESGKVFTVTVEVDAESELTVRLVQVVY